MMAVIAMQAIAIFCCIFLAEALDVPTDVKITKITHNSIKLTFTKSSDATNCEINARAILFSEDSYVLNSEETEVELTGLKSNIRYAIKVRCMNDSGTTSEYAEPIEARTTPGGSKVVISEPLARIFTAFVDPIPGATEWTLQLLNHRTNTTSIAAVSSPYKVYRYQMPNTEYTLRARVSKWNSTVLTEDQSPYGNPLKITTAKNSIFGRVTLDGESWSPELKNPSSQVFTTTAKKWEAELLKEYSLNQSLVAGIDILEFENSASGIVAHHEIFLSSPEIPDLATFRLDGRTFEVTADVKPDFQYVITLTPADRTTYAISVAYDINTLCSGTIDMIKFLSHRHNGEALSIPMFTGDPGISSDSYFQFENKKILDGAGRATELKGNSLFSFDQIYLIKTCASSNTNLLYSRRYGAYNPFTIPGFNDTMIYSTGPDSMDVTGVTYTVSSNLRTIILKIPAVYRAIQYKASLPGLGESILTNLDSSEYLEMSLSGFTEFAQYCAMLSYTIRHPDPIGGTATSESSCFPFYAGSPNSTLARVVGVTEFRFRVIFSAMPFATSYIVQISNSTYSKNYTTQTTEFSTSKNLYGEEDYNVRVATQNPFGVSGFSPTKSTKFWAFKEITNNSMRVEWERDTDDSYYEVSTSNGTARANLSETLLENLQGGTPYDVKITAVTKSGQRLNLFTDTQITVPDTTATRLAMKNAYNIRIAWDVLSGVDYHIINITGKGVDRSNRRDGGTPDNILFTNLRSGSKYRIIVSFYNSAGSSHSTQEYVTDFATPGGLTVETVTNNSVTSTWGEINGANEYMVTVKLVSSGAVVINSTVKQPPYAAENLEAGRNYTFSVIAIYDEGISAASQPLYQITAPDAVKNLGMTSNSASSITIQWDTTTGAEYYSVIVQGRSEVRNTSTTNMEVLNLKPNSEYRIEVVGHNSAGSGSGLKKSFFTEFITPTDVVVYNIAMNSFMVNWTGHDDALQYEVSTNTGNNTKNKISTANYVEINELEYSTNYSVSVTGVYALARSDPSKPVFVMTAIAPPTNLRSTQNNTDSIKIEWDAVRGTVFYTGRVDGLRDFNTTSAGVDLTGLESGTEYVVRVRAEGESSVSNYTLRTFATVPQNPIVTLANNTNTSLTISWNQSKGANGYQVSVTGQGGIQVTGLPGLGFTSDTNVTINGLDPDSNYEIKVLASSEAGSSSQSQPLKVEAVPPMPTGFKLSSRTPSSLVITWEAVLNVTQYDVTTSGTSVTVSSNSYQLTKLSAGTYYLIKVKSINRSGRKSEAASIAYQTLPKSPEISVDDVSYSTIKLSWPQVKGADGYNVTVIEESSGILQEDYTTLQNFSNLSNLTAGTWYTINVTSLLEGEHSLASTVRVITEFITPTNVVVSNIEMHSFMVNWTGHDDALQYEVSVNTGNNTKNTNSTAEYLKIGGLEYSTNYSVTVTGVYALARSDPSKPVYAMTNIAPPTNLRSTQNNTDSIKIEWDAIRGTALYTGRVDGLRDFNTTNSGFDLAGLEPGSEYVVSVRAEGILSVSSYTIGTFATVPTNPTVTLTNITNTSMTISWNPSKGANGYQVSVTGEGGIPVTGLPGLGFTTDTAVTINGLNPDSNYEIKVLASSNAGSSPQSQPLKVEAAPPMPTDFELLSRTTSAFVITWKAVLNATQYDVMTSATSVTVSSNSYQLTKLSAGTYYSTRVSSINRSGRKSQAASVTYQTLPNSPDISVGDVSHTTIRISWPQVKGADRYNVTIAFESSETVQEDYVTIQNFSNLSNLTAGTLYTINVTSVFEGENSPASTVKVTTKSSPPSGIEVTSITQSTVSLKWSSSQGADSYDVVVKEALNRKRRSLDTEPTVSVTNTTATVENLMSGKSYSIKVVSINPAGRSESESISIKTGVGNPKDFCIENVTTTSFTVEWDQEPGADGYRVVVTGPSNQTKDISTNSTQVEIHSLKPGNDYEVTVQTVSTVEPGSKTFVNTENMTKEIVITVPLTPSGFGVAGEDRVVTVSWNKTIGAVKYFLLMESATKINKTFETDGTNRTLMLEDDKLYTFRIYAVNAHDLASAVSDSISYSAGGSSAAYFDWWIIFIIVLATVVLLIVIACLVVCCKKKCCNANAADMYDTLHPNPHFEVATNNLTMVELGKEGNKQNNDSLNREENGVEGPSTSLNNEDTSKDSDSNIAPSPSSGDSSQRPKAFSTFKGPDKDVESKEIKSISPNMKRKKSEAISAKSYEGPQTATPDDEGSEIGKDVPEKNHVGEE